MNFKLLGLVLASVLALAYAKPCEKRFPTGIPARLSNGKRWDDYNYDVPQKVYQYQENLSIPESVDWRGNFIDLPVEQQGDCQSCYAYSILGAIEFQSRIKCEYSLSASRPEIVECASSFGTLGCNGGHVPFAFNYVMNKGISNMFDFTSCNSTKGDHKISGITHVKYGDTRSLKQILALNGPISIGINASLNSFANYKSGVYDGLDNETNQYCDDNINHAVLLVGYGKYDGQDVWIVKNSWGMSWGDEGYMYLKRDDKTNLCGISSYAWIPYIDNCEAFVKETR